MQKYCFTCGGPTASQTGRANNRLMRLKKYGVTHAEWVVMVQRHEGKCWICRDRDAVALDHSHKTGRPRGALCMHCNSQLGAIEKEGWLDSALTYLKETSGEKPCDR